MAGDTNNRYDVFVHDRQTGATQRASVVDGSGAQASNDSFAPSISADGRFVAFTSLASDLAAGGVSSGSRDIYVHDRQTGTTQRVGVTGSSIFGDDGGFYPSISPDGHYVGLAARVRLGKHRLM
jgi:Tol biopolymer transport system component